MAANRMLVVLVGMALGLCTGCCKLCDHMCGNRCQPPVYGPAAGALIEAYRAAGLHPTLSHVPEFKV